ncbi:MAG TPA: tyrosine-type recombinase/integrase, partial [Acidimicrobiales bacterium]|nr:tyrosine-type recombinase/integrase [Acidimicrobiales bacterium]
TDAGRRTIAIPPNVLPAVEEPLEEFVGPESDAWLLGTSTGTAISPRNFQRCWDKAREEIGRPDLHLHDMRHSGLTRATTGASVAELMRRGGHANARGALRYQHATEDRDRALAEAMAELDMVTPINENAGHRAVEPSARSSSRREAR